MVAPGPTGEFLYERADELDAIERAVGDLTARGRGRVLVFGGVPGIGKTTLLEAAVLCATDSGARVLVARGTELESGLAFGTIRELFAPSLLSATEEGRAALLSGPAALATRVLEDNDSSTTRSGGGTVLADPLYGLFWFCANLAELQPMVLVVDDLHWVDEESLRFLAYLAPRLEGLPIAMVVAARPVHGERTVALDAVSSAGTVMCPRPLSREAVARLIVRSLVEDPASDTVGEIHRMTGGNPFLVAELTRSIGDLRLASIEDPQAVPGELATVVVRRLGKMSPSARSLARAVAVFADEALLSDAAEVAELDLDVAAETADALVRAGLLAPGGRLCFIHPLTRAAVYEEMGEFARRRGHGRAASALHRRGAPPEEVAVHVLAGEPVGDPVHEDVLLASASAATTRGAPRAAIRYLERALQEPLDRRRRWAVLGQLGRLQAMVGGAEAEETLRRTVAEARTPEEGVDAAIDAATALYSRLALDEAVEILLPLYRGGFELDRERLLKLSAVLAAVAWGSRSYGGVYIAVADSLPADLDGATSAERLALAQVGARMFDRCEPHEAVLAVLRRCVGDEEPTLAVSGIDLGDPLSLMMACAALDDAETVCLRRQDQAVATGRETLYLAAVLGRARVSFLRGNLIEAEGLVHLALEVPENEWVRIPASSLLATVLAAAGRHDEARTAVDAADDASAATMMWTTVARRRAALDVADGHAAAALPVFEQAHAAHAARASLNPAESLWLCDLADAFRSLGRVGDAVSVLRELLDRAERFGAPQPIGLAHLALGRCHRGPQGIDHFEAAAVVLEPSPYRLDFAWTQLEIGAALRRANRRVQARPKLQLALSEGERLGASGLVARAREELRAAGARPRRTALTGVDSLTPSERRIAALAASGITNREIAQDLFLTVKTVEMHLGRAFRKLGISTRRDLPEWLSDSTRGP